MPFGCSRASHFAGIISGVRLRSHACGDGSLAGSVWFLAGSSKQEVPGYCRKFLFSYHLFAGFALNQKMQKADRFVHGLGKDNRV